MGLFSFQGGAAVMFTRNPLALIGHAQIDRNAKLLLTLQSSTLRSGNFSSQILEDNVTHGI
jgi:hypothetical protein